MGVTAEWDENSASAPYKQLFLRLYVACGQSRRKPLTNHVPVVLSPFARDPFQMPQGMVARVFLSIKLRIICTSAPTA